MSRWRITACYEHIGGVPGPAGNRVASGKPLQSKGYIIKYVLELDERGFGEMVMNIFFLI